VADTLDVSRSNLVERSKGRSKPRGRYNKAEDDELLPIIRRLVDQRPTYGYRRIAALLNRERRGVDQPVVNAKRVHRIMGNHAMLEKHTALRQGRVYDGKGMVMCSNLRWCSDGLEFTCWSGEVVRLAFTIDAFDREIIAWTVVANAGISVGRGAPKELEGVVCGRGRNPTLRLWPTIFSGKIDVFPGDRRSRLISSMTSVAPA